MEELQRQYDIRVNTQSQERSHSAGQWLEPIGFALSPEQTSARRSLDSDRTPEGQVVLKKKEMKRMARKTEPMVRITSRESGNGRNLVSIPPMNLWITDEELENIRSGKKLDGSF